MSLVVKRTFLYVYIVFFAEPVFWGNAITENRYSHLRPEAPIAILFRLKKPAAGFLLPFSKVTPFSVHSVCL